MNTGESGTITTGGRLVRSRETVIKVLCTVAAAVPGLALLGKVYGIIPMDVGVPFVVIPAALFLLLCWTVARVFERSALADTLSIGFLAGLFGVVAGDLMRTSFLLTGEKVFAPIAAYGIWILDADYSTRYTDLTGWTYHIACGVSFGILYALFMRWGHWMWGVLWGSVLATLLLFSPFGTIFNMEGNSLRIVIHYMWHGIYGLPLGFMVQRWDGAVAWRRSVPLWKWIGGGGIAAALAAFMLYLPAFEERDRTVVPGVFTVVDQELVPDWQRIERGEQIIIRNPGRRMVQVHLLDDPSPMRIPAQKEMVLTCRRPGVEQIVVVAGPGSPSSFVMVEPVDQVR